MATVNRGVALGFVAVTVVLGAHFWRAGRTYDQAAGESTRHTLPLERRVDRASVERALAAIAAERAAEVAARGPAAQAPAAAAAPAAVAAAAGGGGDDGTAPATGAAGTRG